MKNKKRVFSIAVIIIVFIGIVYYLVPKTGSFNDLIISRFPEKSINSISVDNPKDKIYINNKDKDKVNEFVVYLSKLKLVQYRFQVPKDGLDYSIQLTLIGHAYDNAIISNYISITMINKNYITIKTAIDDKIKEGTYRIDNGGFDLKYIDKLLGK